MLIRFSMYRLSRSPDNRLVKLFPLQQGVFQPYEESDDDKGSGSQHHQAIVEISQFVKYAGHHLESEQLSETQQLPEESNAD
jgi:hypothetical protein